AGRGDVQAVDVAADQQLVVDQGGDQALAFGRLQAARVLDGEIALQQGTGAAEEGGEAGGLVARHSVEHRLGGRRVGEDRLGEKGRRCEGRIGPEGGGRGEG